MYDLIVIGGGPAGSAAAITAARHGANVLALERGRIPRHKVCGEFVSAESLSLLESLLAAGGASLLREAVRIPRARVFLDGRTLLAPVDPPAASIARLELDSALWNSAASVGVGTRQQTIVQGVSGDSPFLVKTNAGEFVSKAVIDASGRWSNLIRDPVRNGGKEKKWLGIKAHFLEHSAEPSVDLYFFSGGYCGVQPVAIRDNPSQRRVNASAMVRADTASSLPEIFALHPQLRERSRSWKPLTEPVSTAPLFFRKPKTERSGALLAGDAAAFVDPFVGDGISLALRSGTLAAECLLPFFRDQASLQDCRQNYRGEYDQRFASVFRNSGRMRQMLFLPRSVRRPVLFFLAKTPGVMRYLVKRTR